MKGLLLAALLALLPMNAAAVTITATWASTGTNVVQANPGEDLFLDVAFDLEGSELLFAGFGWDDDVSFHHVDALEGVAQIHFIAEDPKNDGADIVLFLINTNSEVAMADAVVNIPDPATLGLLGFGMLGLVGLSRWRVV